MGREFDYSRYKHWIDPAEAVPYDKNAKIHTEAQVRNIANSISRFGWRQECVITRDNVVVIGHGRRLAALKLGCKMPVQVIDADAENLTEDDIRELRTADNLTNAETGFDLERLGEELGELDFEGFEFDLGAIGLGDIPGAVSDSYTAPREDSSFSYKEQYAVTVMCHDEADQRAVYERLTDEGYNCRVVCV